MNISTSAAQAYFTHLSKPAGSSFGPMAFQRLTAARFGHHLPPTEPTAKPAVAAREESPSQPVELTKAATTAIENETGNRPAPAKAAVTAIEHAVNNRPPAKAPVTARQATNADRVTLAGPATSATPTVGGTSAAVQLADGAPVDLVA